MGESPDLGKKIILCPRKETEYCGCLELNCNVLGTPRNGKPPRSQAPSRSTLSSGRRRRPPACGGGGGGPWLARKGAPTPFLPSPPNTSPSPFRSFTNVTCSDTSPVGSAARGTDLTSCGPDLALSFPSTASVADARGAGGLRHFRGSWSALVGRAVQWASSSSGRRLRRPSPLGGRSGEGCCRCLGACVTLLLVVCSRLPVLRLIPLVRALQAARC